MIIKAVIVDDEEYSRVNLKNLIGKYCKHIEVVGTAESVATARTIIKVQVPDVIFLDINMPNESGFDLLTNQKKDSGGPLVVFVTAYNQYAIKAIKVDAVDYILKPIDIKELINCEQKLKRLLDPKYNEKTNNEENIPKIDIHGKVSINHSRGVKLLHFSSIVYLQADNNYTTIHVMSGNKKEKLMVSRNLGYFEQLLPHQLFFRLHNSFIINLDLMKEYSNEGKGRVIMSEGTTIELSRRKKNAFRQLLKDRNNSQNNH